MSSTLSLLIRDGQESDILPCLELDHSYDTEYVWQMRSHQDSDQQQVTFVKERLPRQVTFHYPADESRIRAVLPASHGYVVSVDREHQDILGYMTLQSAPIYSIAHIHDLVVTRPYRHRRIGARLLNVARQWAREHNLSVLTIGLQTRNYPGIAFCQQAGLVFSGYSDHYYPNQDIAIFFSQSLR